MSPRGQKLALLRMKFRYLSARAVHFLRKEELQREEEPRKFRALSLQSTGSERLEEGQGRAKTCGRRVQMHVATNRADLRTEKRQKSSDRPPAGREKNEAKPNGFADEKTANSGGTLAFLHFCCPCIHEKGVSQVIREKICF